MHSERLSTPGIYNNGYQTVLNPAGMLWVEETIRQTVEGKDNSSPKNKYNINSKTGITTRTHGRHRPSKQKNYPAGSREVVPEGSAPSVSPASVAEAPKLPKPMVDDPVSMTVLESAPRGQKAVEDSPEFPAPNEFDTAIFYRRRLAIPGTRKQQIGISAATLVAVGAGFGAMHELPEQSHDSTPITHGAEPSLAPETPYALQGYNDRYAYNLSPELIEITLSPEEKAVFITEAIEILSIVEDNSHITVEGGNRITVVGDNSKDEHTQATIEYDAASRELLVHAHVVLDESGAVNNEASMQGTYNTIQIVLRLGDGNSLEWLTDELTIKKAREAIVKSGSEVDLVSVFGQYPDLDASDGVRRSYQMLIQPSTVNPGSFQIGSWDRTYVNRVVDFEDEASVPRVVQLSGLAVNKLREYDN